MLQAGGSPSAREHAGQEVPPDGRRFVIGGIAIKPGNSGFCRAGFVIGLRPRTAAVMARCVGPIVPERAPCESGRCNNHREPTKHRHFF